MLFCEGELYNFKETNSKNENPSKNVTLNRKNREFRFFVFFLRKSAKPFSRLMVLQELGLNCFFCGVLFFLKKVFYEGTLHPKMSFSEI